MIEVKRYQCELCGHIFETEEHALNCESRPVTQRKHKIGDQVMVLGGEGKGEIGVVKQCSYSPISWGPKRYWHMPLYIVDVEGGSRMLTFDQIGGV